MISLKLIDNTVTDYEIRLLAKWRKKVQPLWQETFKVTYQGTKKWINDINDNKKRRLFFIISDGDYIGHVGFEKKSRNLIYIDNVIRGEGESGGEMSQAVLILVELARFLYIENIYVKVLKHLAYAIRFYEKLGFKHYKELPKLYYVLKYEKS